jgi:hypothetical protein
MNINRGLVGAILGLVVGLVVGIILQRAMEGVGGRSILIILVVILGAVLGAYVRGPVGAIAGAIGGAVVGILTVGLFFTLMKLTTIILGAALGWRLAAPSDKGATA